jgi:outer membrane lipoprotein SlyB
MSQSTTPRSGNSLRVARGVAIVSAVVASVHLTGCAAPGAGGYGPSALGGVSSPSMGYQTPAPQPVGRIVSIEQLVVGAESQTGIGAVAGAVLGGAAANHIGGGRGRTVSTVIGAVGGAVAGSAIESGMNRQLGQRIYVQFQDGSRAVVVQPADPRLAVGISARIVGEGPSARVVPHP